MKKLLKEHSSVILSIGAGAGVLTTAYLTGKASFQAAHVFEDKDPEMEFRDRVNLVWKLYVPAGTVAATTILCIVGVKRIDAKKTLAAQTALAISQGAYEAYRAQIIEEFGERKDKIILAKTAEKQVANNPPAIIVGGSGTILCCERFTGRYFMSDMDGLNKAVNEVNAKMLKHDYATLDDLYYLIGLENTVVSGQTGWESSKLLVLEFSTVLSEGRPCLAFDYNYVKTF